MSIMMTRRLAAGSSAAALLLAGGQAGAGYAGADPVVHQVTYIVSVQNAIWADIFYQDQDPAIFSDYGHNPYAFTPQVKTDIAPGRPWVQQVPLSNPDQWAMVTVTSGTEPGTPHFHCDLAVDGKVVVSKDGAKGVLCSLRTW